MGCVEGGRKDHSLVNQNEAPSTLQATLLGGHWLTANQYYPLYLVNTGDSAWCTTGTRTVQPNLFSWRVLKVHAAASTSSWNVLLV